jgi:hypothetical protein
LSERSKDRMSELLRGLLLVGAIIIVGWKIDDRIDNHIAPIEQEVKELRVQVQKVGEALANLDGKLNAMGVRLDKRF